jgi:hypothetical protein
MHAQETEGRVNLSLDAPEADDDSAGRRIITPSLSMTIARRKDCRVTWL